MWFKHRAWVPVASLLCLANVVAVWFAAQPAEPWHATAHAVLAVVFGLGARHLALRTKSAADSDLAGQLRELEAQLAEVDSLPAADGRVAALEERLDFLERALVEVRTRAHLPHKE